MNITRNLLRLTLAIVALASDTAGAQRIPVPVARLHSASDTARMHAFYDIVMAARDPQRPDQRLSSLSARAVKQDDLAAELISLLSRENTVVATAAPGSLSSDYLGGYYVDLLVTVARMRDPRSLSELVRGIGCGSGVVYVAIAGFGDIAVQPVIAALNGRDEDTRVGALLTLREILTNNAKYSISERSTSLAKQALLLKIDASDDAFVRSTAIDALMPLSGPDIRAAMLRAAAHDTSVYGVPGGTQVHPVRAAAMAWLTRHPPQ